MDNWILLCCMSISNLQYSFIILKPFLLFLLKLFDIHMYTITNKDKINNIRNLVKDSLCMSYSDESKPLGLVIHNKLIAYFPEDYQGRLVYILIHNNYKYEILDKTNKPHIVKIIPKEFKQEESESKIDYCYRTGDYSFFEYNKSKMYINTNLFTEQQRQIYDNIMDIYNTKNNVKCYLYGNVNSGKTFLAYLMARELNCYLCDTFNPTEPSDNFSNIYNCIHPTPKKPLILLLDEVDILINKIHNQMIIPHKHNSIQVYNKTTWNNMLDKLDYGLYPNVILLLCSNLSVNDINKLDPSYLRQGRIDLIQHLLK